MQDLLLRSVLGLALLFALFVSNQARAFDYDIRNGRLVAVRIGGNDLKIPARYYLPGRPRTGEQEAILLQALLPGMEPMREDNMHEFLNTKGWGRILNLLIHDARHTTSVEFRLNATKKLGEPYARAEDSFGLEVYKPEGPRGRTTIRPEIYVSRNAGAPNGYIECARDGSVPFPHCSQEWVYREMLFRASYGKSFLPVWESLKRSIEELLDSFSQQTFFGTQPCCGTPPLRKIRRDERLLGMNF